MRIVVPLVLVALLLASCASKTPTELSPSDGVTTFETEKVVLVIIDGLRYSEGLGQPTRAVTNEP